MLVITEVGTQPRNSPLMCCNIEWVSDAIVSTPAKYQWWRFMGAGVFKCQDPAYRSRCSRKFTRANVAMLWGEASQTQGRAFRRGPSFLHPPHIFGECGNKQINKRSRSTSALWHTHISRDERHFWRRDRLETQKSKWSFTSWGKADLRVRLTSANKPDKSLSGSAARQSEWILWVFHWWSYVYFTIGL